MTAAQQKSVLILGNYRPTLAIARILADDGYHIIVSEAHHGAAGARYSRFVDEMWAHPPLEQDGAFAEALNRFLRERPDIEAIFPVEENYLAWLAHHRAEIEPRAVVVSPSPQIVEITLDKFRMIELAKSAGVACHHHKVANTLAELRAQAHAIGFPVIVKPLSHLNRIGNKKGVICEDAGELDCQFPVWPANQTGLLVQRYVRGDRRDVYFIAQAGIVEALLETNVTRTDDPDGTGISTQGTFVAVTPSTAEDTRRLAKALAYTGIGVAQYIVNGATGETAFLELNARNSASHGCAEHQGMGLTRAALRLAKGGALSARPAPFTYATGGHYCWTLGDLYGLKEALLRKTIGRKQALAWAAAATRGALAAEVHLTWSLRDPLPALALLFIAIARALKLPGFRRQ